MESSALDMPSLDWSSVIEPMDYANFTLPSTYADVAPCQVEGQQQLPKSVQCATSIACSKCIDGLAWILPYVCDENISIIDSMSESQYSLHDAVDFLTRIRCLIPESRLVIDSVQTLNHRSAIVNFTFVSLKYIIRGGAKCLETGNKLTRVEITWNKAFLDTLHRIREDFFQGEVTQNGQKADGSEGLHLELSAPEACLRAAAPQNRDETTSAIIQTGVHRREKIWYQKSLYVCFYCETQKSSGSSPADGRVRMRCGCGGKYGDSKPRMHAHWTRVETKN